jgi:hypothetical protein
MLAACLPIARADDKAVEAPKPTIVTPKQTVSGDALNALAKEASTLTDKIKAATNAAQDALNKTNAEYAKQVDVLQAKINANAEKAQAAFTEAHKADLNMLQTRYNQIQGFIPVVRKEGGLPDAAQYDIQTQTWAVPPAPAAPKK